MPHPTDDLLIRGHHETYKRQESCHHLSRRKGDSLSAHPPPAAGGERREGLRTPTGGSDMPSAEASDPALCPGTLRRERPRRGHDTGTMDKYRRDMVTKRRWTGSAAFLLLMIPFLLAGCGSWRATSSGGGNSTPTAGIGRGGTPTPTSGAGSGVPPKITPVVTPTATVMPTDAPRLLRLTWQACVGPLGGWRPSDLARCRSPRTNGRAGAARAR